MAATDRLFAGSIPEVYDRFLVPFASATTSELSDDDPRGQHGRRGGGTLDAPAPRPARPYAGLAAPRL